jgi:hypothetical protein
MKALNARIRSDPFYRALWLSSILKAAGSPAKKRKLSKLMRATMAKPENRAKAARHASEINRDPDVRRRQTAGKRGVAVPESHAALYRKLVRKVGGAEALRIIRDGLARAISPGEAKPAQGIAP